MQTLSIFQVLVETVPDAVLLLSLDNVSPLTMAFHVVKVYVMCVCRGNMWAVKASRKGEGKRKEGETVLTNTKR